MQLSNKSDKQEQNGFYQTLNHLINKVVMRHVSRGVIPTREQEDVKTSILEKFLLKQNKIDGSFQGKSKIATYYTAVINRMCAEVIRKEQKHWYAVNEFVENSTPHDATLSFDAAKEVLVKEELKRFMASIMLFNGSQSKVILLLKYYYDIPLLPGDVANYAGDKEKEAIKILAGRSGLSKSVVNERLAKLVFLVEQKKMTGDAIRMWINKQVDILLYRMNGRNKSFHNKETIGVMLEMKFNTNQKIDNNKGYNALDDAK
jgi:DNA-directed RNA polymerase specialized sigma24 family protein